MHESGFDLLAPNTGITCAHCGAPLHAPQLPASACRPTRASSLRTCARSRASLPGRRQTAEAPVTEPDEIARMARIMEPLAYDASGACPGLSAW